MSECDSESPHVYLNKVTEQYMKGYYKKVTYLILGYAFKTKYASFDSHSHYNNVGYFSL